MDKLIAFFDIVSRYSNFYLYGFGIFYLVFFLIDKVLINKIITSAKAFVPIVGVVFFLAESLCFGLPFIKENYDGVSNTQYSFGNSINSTVYTVIIFPIVFKFLPTQFFWFKKVRNSIWLVLLSVPFFIFDFNRIYIFITSFHRDYLPSSWTMSTESSFEKLIYSLFCFVFVTLLWNYKKEWKDRLFKIVKK